MWLQTIDRVDCHPDCRGMFDPAANAEAAARWFLDGLDRNRPPRDYSGARGDTARIGLDER
jgi:hypothetical protein